MPNETPMTHAAALLAMHRELTESRRLQPDAVDALVIDANRILLAASDYPFTVKRYTDV